MSARKIILNCVTQLRKKATLCMARGMFMISAFALCLFSAVLSFFFAGCLSLNTSPAPEEVIKPQDYVIATNSVSAKNKPSVTIIRYTGSDQVVSIPRTLGGLPVTSIGPRAFYSCGLTKVVIGNRVTCIGTSAFANTRSLDTVVIGASVTNIGIQAFAYGLNIKAFDVSKQNTRYCSVDGVLFDKFRTTLVQYPNGRAGVYSIPESVTRIGDSAFWACYHVTSLTIPDSVTQIDNNAFDSCSRLTSVRIGANVTRIGSSAFMYCENLPSIDLPDRLVHIGNASFAQCRSLTSITIPNSVEHIGNGAFSTCHKLTEVKLGNRVTYIGYNAFMECRSLSRITWPSRTTTVEENAFSYCHALTDVTLPEGVSIIRDLAFRGCTKLASITIPSTVTDIGLRAFADCPSLKDVYFMGNAPRAGGCLWTNSDSVTVYYLRGKNGWSTTFCGSPTKISE